RIWCLIIGEIAKFGVKTTELDDGLEVHGQDQSTLKEGVSVHCYDDHRVAMAFSVLATRIKGSVIEKKRCVEKTWPGWWDDLHNKIVISVEGVDLEKASGSGSQTTHDPAASVFLIGMRGAGKSHIARLAGETLDWEVVDADSVFAQKIEVIDEKIKEIPKSPDFGGASVTIPLKLDIVPLLDGVSPAAKLIGAVNTIVVRTAEDGTRTLHGDNTDWMGVAACIKERLSRCTKSLVIGGGGTSRAAIYALHNLGATTIYLYNRTRSTAENLAKHFPSDYNIILVDSLETFPSGAPSAIVSTVPATAISPEPVTDKMHITPVLLGSKSGGIIVDMAYRLAPTPLIRLARSVSHPEWRATEGIGGLLEQGYRQFRAWTTMKAPQGIIRRMVREKYH
ncbi:hypothetical protein M422DRAFT_33798, partial [Sphaerobolus stellatus SS14]